MKEAFFFGEQSLFGIYYPSVDPMSDRLVVVCAPFFDEYQRTYRALAELADAFSQKGFHVLRFDYRATGESYGNLDSVQDYREWTSDIETAIEEGMALSGATDVTLLGVRFGATLADKVSHENVQRYLFWDPFSSGKDFLSSIRDTNAWLRETLEDNAEYTCSQFDDTNPSMFVLSEALINSISGDDMEQMQQKGSTILLSKGSGTHTNDATRILMDFEYDWPAFEEGLLRPRLVQELLLENAD